MNQTTVSPTGRPIASDHLLCVGDADELCRRYERAEGFARQWMERLIWTARHADQHTAFQLSNLGTLPQGSVRPSHRPDETAYSALAYLFTRDTSLAAITRRQLLALADSVAERETSDTTQNHCWCDAFPFARWLILYDWVYDSGVFSEQDHAYLAERFAYYIWAHPYQRLRARAIEGTARNNQNATMAFACAVGGYVFGLGRGTDRRAARICELGLHHLTRFLTAFPHGGYSYEGSTYMGKVNAAVIPLALEVVRTITGVDLVDSREDHACASPREVLESIMRLSSPSGLLLPWDNYGYELATFAPAAAYLARRTGNDAGLQLLASRHLLNWPSHAGWGFDKMLWTVLYLPEAFEPRNPTDDEIARLLNHAAPNVGAAATGPAHRLYVYQMWDRSSPTPSREHFNPNSLVMEYDGSPLLLDGWCPEHAKAKEFDTPLYHRRKPDTGNQITIGPGTVGAHNTIFLDDEPHYVSPRATSGKLIGAHYQPGVALFEADVTDCFRDRYDVRTVRRATCVLGDDLVLVRDRIISDSERKVSWRTHVRDGDAVADVNSVTITTLEGVRLDICAPAGAVFEHAHRVGEAESNSVCEQLEGRCHELTRHAHGRDVTLTTLIVLTAMRRVKQDLSAGWQRAQARDHAQARQWLASWPGGEAVDLADQRIDATPAPGVSVYRREFTLDEPADGKLWLTLPRLLGPARVHINDTTFDAGYGDERDPLVPEQLEIAAALHEGMNVVAIVTHTTLDWDLAGRVTLCEPMPPIESPRLVEVDADTFDLHHHGRCTRITWGDETCTINEPGADAVKLRLAPPPEPDSEHHATSTDAISAAIETVSERASQLAASDADDPSALAQAIMAPDWRIALAALEDAEGRCDSSVVEAAWKRLREEHASHPTTFPRDPADVCWYRLKAACVRVLGAARYEPAVGLMGQLLVGEDFYPVRAMCAQALGRIATPEARSWLEQISADEQNTQLHAERALRQLDSQ